MPLQVGDALDVARLDAGGLEALAVEARARPAALDRLPRARVAEGLELGGVHAHNSTKRLSDFSSARSAPAGSSA